MPDIFDRAVQELESTRNDGHDSNERALQLANIVHRHAEAEFGVDGLERSLDPLATCLHGRAHAGETYACLVLLAAACDIAADVVNSTRDGGGNVRQQHTRPLLQIAGDLLFNDDSTLINQREVVPGSLGEVVMVPARAGTLTRPHDEDREGRSHDDLLAWCAVHLWAIGRILDECSGDGLSAAGIARFATVVRALRTLDHAQFMHAEIEEYPWERDAYVEAALAALFNKRSRLTGRLAQSLRDRLGLEPPLFIRPGAQFIPGRLSVEDWDRTTVREALEVARHLDAGELNDALRSLARAIHAGLNADDIGQDERSTTARRLRAISCGIAWGMAAPVAYDDMNRAMGELVSFTRECFQINLPETREPGLPRAVRAHVEAHLEALAVAIDPPHAITSRDAPRASIWRGQSDLFRVPRDLSADHIISSVHDRLRVHNPSSDNVDRVSDERRDAEEELARARGQLLSLLEEMEDQADIMLEDDDAIWPLRGIVIPLIPGATGELQGEGVPFFEMEYRRDGTPLNIDIDSETGQLIRTTGTASRGNIIPDIATRYLEAAEEHGRARDEAARHGLRRSREERFSRQEAVPGWDQGRLRRAVVVVAGVGGLGAAVVDQLARMGVGTVRVVDHDRVEDSNISRQCLYIADDVGSLKVDAAARRVSDLDGPTRVVPRPAYLCERNALMLVAGADVVFDCLDSEKSKHLLNHACARAGVPLVHGGCTGFIGQAMAVVPGRTACLACRELTFSVADTASCTRDETLPIVAPTAQLVASLQVDLALHVLMGTGDVPSGLLLYDGRGPGVRSVPVERRDDCPVCGGNGTTDDDVRTALSLQSQDSLLQIAGAVGMEHADGMDTSNLVEALVDVFSALPDGRHRALRLASGVQFIEEAMS
ncbi:MAG: HesA/MoeB/ThiF family protein [Candidatus Undinarchaeales archaeon]|nr:HesA/MoeB/ThiF family protein [Candidatus Undinarchaeales archaeon]